MKQKVEESPNLAYQAGFEPETTFTDHKSWTQTEWNLIHHGEERHAAGEGELQDWTTKQQNNQCEDCTKNHCKVWTTTPEMRTEPGADQKLEASQIRMKTKMNQIGEEEPRRTRWSGSESANDAGKTRSDRRGWRWNRWDEPAKNTNKIERRWNETIWNRERRSEAWNVSRSHAEEDDRNHDGPDLKEKWRRQAAAMAGKASLKTTSRIRREMQI